MLENNQHTAPDSRNALDATLAAIPLPEMVELFFVLTVWVTRGFQ